MIQRLIIKLFKRQYPHLVFKFNNDDEILKILTTINNKLLNIWVFPDEKWEKIKIKIDFCICALSIILTINYNNDLY